MEKQVRMMSVDADLVGEVSIIEGIEPDLKKRIIERLSQGTPLQSDSWIYRLVVSFLGLAMVFTIVALALLAVMGKSSIPDGLVAIGSAAVGALSGLLAPSPNR